jgi:hypothetical protein
MWIGYASPEWAWLKADSLLFLSTSCANRLGRKGGSNESISKVITYDLALSVSYCLGAEVSLQGIDRECTGIDDQWD